MTHDLFRIAVIRLRNNEVFSLCKLYLFRFTVLIPRSPEMRAPRREL
jgi:hypothetical protein